MNSKTSVDSRANESKSLELDWSKVVKEGKHLVEHGYGVLTVYVRKHKIKRIEPTLIIE